MRITKVLLLLAGVLIIAGCKKKDKDACRTGNLIQVVCTPATLPADDTSTAVITFNPAPPIPFTLHATGGGIIYNGQLPMATVEVTTPNYSLKLVAGHVPGTIGLTLNDSCGMIGVDSVVLQSKSNIDAAIFPMSGLSTCRTSILADAGDTTLVTFAFNNTVSNNLYLGKPVFFTTAKGNFITLTGALADTCTVLVNSSGMASVILVADSIPNPSNTVTAVFDNNSTLSRSTSIALGPLAATLKVTAGNSPMGHNAVVTLTYSSGSRHMAGRTVTFTNTAGIDSGATLAGLFIPGNTSMGTAVLDTAGKASIQMLDTVQYYTGNTDYISAWVFSNEYLATDTIGFH